MEKKNDVTHMNLQEAGDYLAISRQAVHYLAHSGRLQSEQSSNGAWSISVAACEIYKKEKSLGLRVKSVEFSERIAGRRELVLEAIEDAKGHISVNGLAKSIGASGATVTQDLIFLGYRKTVVWTKE